MLSASRQCSKRSLAGISRVFFSDFSHVKEDGSVPRMVDVSNKSVTKRRAHARCYVQLPQSVYEKIRLETKSKEIFSKKGPVITTSIIGGVMAAKKTHELIPFCHQIPLDGCDVTIAFDDDKIGSLRVDCIASTQSKTGVEMEALVGASNCALCIYDMCKAVSHDIKINDIHLVSKTGGKSDYNT